MRWVLGLSPLANEETGAQRGQLTGSRSHSSPVAEWDPDPQQNKEVTPRKRAPCLGTHPESTQMKSGSLRPHHQVPFAEREISFLLAGAGRPGLPGLAWGQSRGHRPAWGTCPRAEPVEGQALPAAPAPPAPGFSGFKQNVCEGRGLGCRH